MRIVNFISETSFTAEQNERLVALGELIDVPAGVQTEEQTIAFLEDADYVLMAPTTVPFITRKILESAKKLKGIVINTTNFGWVDMKAAEERGIKVLNIPNYSTEAVAELAVGLMFDAARKISQADRFVKAKGVNSWELFEGMELKGKTLGILGLGDIGRRTAELALAIGMDVLAWNRTPKEVPGMTFADKKELLQKSDVVSLHLALAEDTKNFLGEEDFKAMKPGVLLINVSREELIDQKSLLAALKSGALAGYAFEMNEEEWNDVRKEIAGMENVIATPHIGWFTPEARGRSMEMMVKKMEEMVR